jgi:Pyruvate/2-oxoacid:ferredoxin oxidoreductase delta subunit
MRKAGIKGWFLHDIKNRGVTAWLLALALATFYVVLYLGQSFENPSNFVERFQNFVWPATQAMEAFSKDIFGFLKDTSGEPMANRWTLYGALYTLAILGGGAYMLKKYGHNRYQVIRTLVVMFVQVSFAFAIPLLLKFFQHPEYYFSYLWPLKIEYLDPSNFEYFGVALVLYGFVGSLILVPLLGVLFGKRWYCSWVCGCGGLANTFGEPWRHLSDPSEKAWKFEKVTVHTILVLAIVSTIVWFMSAAFPTDGQLQEVASTFRRWYGLAIIAIFSGVVGVAMYPIGGTRIWCRYGCPMAAVLGLVQKFGRFRIRVKDDMCISCGLCTKYCEMGIDVRAYAQANQDFTRASCVGCGLCAEVCPRGVLRLENDRQKHPQELTMNSFLNESWKKQDRSIAI